MRSLLCGALLAAWATTAGAAGLDGPVVRILDGDTIEVLHNQHPERIRLSGIDCPEKGQAFGKRAKQATSELVFGKEVTVQTHGHDKYHRTIADVLLPDGTNVNQELVKQGWCWWYRKYTPEYTVLEDRTGRLTAKHQMECTLTTCPHGSPPRRQNMARHHLSRTTFCPNKRGHF